MSGLKDGIAKLDEANKRLHLHWNETKSLWTDSVQLTFEQTYWQPLEQQVRTTQRELEHLAEVIAKAYQQVNKTDMNRPGFQEARGSAEFGSHERQRRR